ncbi:MAG: BMP family ABC transporter substrate-binding protein [Anaerolineaceae bacterium]|nr:BMP family ABC transporter substrate-binding protein [Anaerolineaceae bacterium]
MSKKYLFILLSILLIASLLVGCGGAAATEEAQEEAAPADEVVEEAPAEETGGFQIPDIQDGKFNIAMVLIGPHDDGGWSQSHYEGLEYVQANMADVHTAYIEMVPEGADAEQVVRSLARKGFDLIYGTSFGYMDSMETVAEEFPNIMFIHVSGYKSNTTNFGNLMGAMENMKYLAGVLAGARAQKDGNPKVGYMATFPIPEELRLGNAFALGMKEFCPDCTMDVRWINTWHDPVIEKEAAASLFDSGCQVVFTGADTPAPADVATERGDVWGITYDWSGSCTAERCLTAPYWNWGPIYMQVAEETRDGTYEPGWHYFDGDSNALGLYGFMEGQELPAGVADLDPEVIEFVREKVAQTLAGEFTRFDVFSGPIVDNQGNVVVPEGEKMVQADLDQFPPGAEGLECDYCMYWWADGVTAELPDL